MSYKLIFDFETAEQFQSAREELVTDIEAIGVSIAKDTEKEILIVVDKTAEL